MTPPYHHNFQRPLHFEESYQDKFLFKVQKFSIILLQFFAPHLILNSLPVKISYLIRAEINSMHAMIFNEQPFQGFGFCPVTVSIGEVSYLTE